MSGLAHDDSYGEACEGNVVWPYESNGFAAQAWRLSPVAIEFI